MSDERTTQHATRNTQHVAIVGGGISGLATGWYLQQAGVSYTLLEASDRWGGKVQTERIDGFGQEPFVIEAGPDSFITQKPWALQLARELGLEDRLLPTNDHKRRTFVLNKGKLTTLPDGVMLIVPTKFMPFALTRLFSPLGKLRMGMDLLIPPKQDNEDETLADFIRRRLGREALDKLAEPLLSGIYNAEAERQSILATFPRFRELEAKHGNLIKGMLASSKERQKAKGFAATNGGAESGGQKLSIFMSMRTGVQELTDALVEKLTGDLRLGVGVMGLTPAGTGYDLALSDGSTLAADRVILAVPANVTADLLEPLSPVAAENLRRIRYVSTGTISLAFRRDEVAHPLNGFGLVIPRSERRPINAITWSSTKFDHRAPEGYVLLRIFFGGSRSPASMDLDDGATRKMALAQLKEILGIDARPVFHRIYRWHQAQAQYDVGHLDVVAAIEAALPPGIHVTGSPYRGVGLPDCVKQAKVRVDWLIG